MQDTPLINFHFQVEWGGSRIGFSEVSGLKVETKIIEYREGSSPVYSPIKIPGGQQYSNIILKRGAFKGDNEFYKWFNTVSLSSIERRDVTISLLDEKHEPIMVWRILNAWPTSVKYAELNAMKSKILIERLELAHEGIRVDNP